MPDPTNQDLKVEHRHGVVVIDVPPDAVVQLLDIAAVYEAMERVVEQSPKRCFLLRFGEVKYVSSTFLGRLIALNKKVKNRGGTLMLSDLDPAVRQVITLAQLDRQLPVYRTAHEAISGRTTPWTVLLIILCINATLGIIGLARLLPDWQMLEGGAGKGIALACFIASIPLPVAIFLARKWFARLDRKFQWTLVGIFAFISLCALPAYLGMG